MLPCAIAAARCPRPCSVVLPRRMPPHRRWLRDGDCGSAMRPDNHARLHPAPSSRFPHAWRQRDSAARRRCCCSVSALHGVCVRLLLARGSSREQVCGVRSVFSGSGATRGRVHLHGSSTRLWFRAPCSEALRLRGVTQSVGTATIHFDLDGLRKQCVSLHVSVSTRLLCCVCAGGGGCRQGCARCVCVPTWPLSPAEPSSLPRGCNRAASGGVLTAGTHRVCGLDRKRVARGVLVAVSREKRNLRVQSVRPVERREDTSERP